MKDEARRTWDKGERIDESVHRFTVGEDPDWDRRLVHWDCLGSAAHARALARAGVLSDQGLRSLLDALAEIDREHAAGRFEIPPDLEDCHTAIEAYLTRACGDAGARIHAGRSRNDQVATAIRLYMRAAVIGWIDRVFAFVETLAARIETDGRIPMPGYTHMQRAMPSSVGQWLHAHAEAALEQARACLDLLDRLDRCPLGTGAGFGQTLDLDRAYTARLLGFTRVQSSPIDAQNSRGRMAMYFVRIAADIGALLEKLSGDVVLFASAEYGFFSLPEAMTTGSSIMPQKRNPDVAELLRARGARIRGVLAELEWVCAKLPSGYHRDLQLSKPPTIRAAEEVQEILGVADRMIGALRFNEDRMRAAMTPEVYATHAAGALVRDGMPFREAYRRIARALRDGSFVGSFDTSAYEGAGRCDPGVVQELRAEVTAVGAAAGAIRARVAAAESGLLGAG